MYDDIWSATSEEVRAIAYDVSRSVVIDHREDDEAVVEYVAALIPQAELSWAWSDDPEDLVIRYQGSMYPVGLRQSEEDRYITLRRLNEVLAGRYEIRAFRASLGSDTHAFWVKPVSWWQEAERQYPTRVEEVFAPLTPELGF